MESNAPMLLFVVKCAYFILPAYFANMAPVIAKNIFRQRFVQPIDFNRSFFDGKPILGRNKTFRGFAAGVLAAMIIAYIQSFLYSYASASSISFYNYENWPLFGFLMGFGAIAGDSIKSFFKRRLNYSPGQKFVPLDQVDFVLGAMLFVLPVYALSLYRVVSILIISFILHVMVNHAAFYLKLRNEKW